MNDTRVSVENFDLSRHAVVEASAGTGKTHTIEQLVLRIILQEHLALEQILVVTFTEKATGELKNRLRSTLERAVRNQDTDAPLLQQSLDHFDQAPIFTIHGFCQRLLHEYALEQQNDFQPPLVDDPALLTALLKEIQRKRWRAEFGDSLRGVLEKAKYNRSTACDWDRRVLEIAQRFKPRCGHQLRPALVPDWWRRLDEADADWAGQLEVFTVHALHEQLRHYKRQRGLQSFDDMIAAVEESLDGDRNPEADSFLHVLRQRYRYGIVDEFQDTDPLQWRIFHRIFLAGGDSRLFIVGDPKQAIYSFRGSDLPTYLNAAHTMKADFDACEYPLDENWRSDPDLLVGLNCLFGDGEWFPGGSGILYRDVHAPDDDKRKTRIDEDRTNRAALTIVDVTQPDRLKLAHRHFVRFMVAEIQGLLAPGALPRLTFSLKNQPARPLNAGDICILVTKRPEAEPIIAGLDRAGIPYSFYKQAGLWECDEATHLEYVLQALARPDDRSVFRRALLTCFFRVKPEELARAPDLPAQHPARQLFQSWLAHAENRQWSPLFRSLLEDTGLLFHDHSERRRANLRLLLAALEQVGQGENLDLVGLLAWIAGRRTKREANETPMTPDGAGRPKVKIMTIHACKGLEFPVVFLAGGFTQGNANRSGFAMYHDEANRLIFDLVQDSEGQERLGAERLSEQRRLLYVALTRPMFKLYVPKVTYSSKQRAWAGPVATILLPALQQACPDKHGPLIADVAPVPLTAIAPTLDAKPAPTPVAPSTPFTIDGPLFPPLDGQLGKRRIVIRSFSSMARHHLASVGDGASFGEQPGPIEDEADTPIDREDPLRGPVFGDMIHQVLEEIDFGEVSRASASAALIEPDAPARRLIDRQVHANIAKLRTRTPPERLEQAARQQMAELVWAALRTPLGELGASLCSLPRRDRIAEVEFLFPEQPGPTRPADRHREDAFVTGFMDLLFRKDGKYYLLDWKTNLLPSYQREAIERSMIDSDYHRQYRLYLQAINRWLRRFIGPAWSLREQFGGVYYLYVRGLNGKNDSSGVYFHRPDERDLDLESVLR